MTKTVPLSEAKARLSSLLDAVAGHDEEIVIKPVHSSAFDVTYSRRTTTKIPYSGCTDRLESGW